MNRLTKLAQRRTRFVILLLLSLVFSRTFYAADHAQAQDEAKDKDVFTLWRTVSPNGNYVLAWTKPGSVPLGNMPFPDDVNSVVQDWLMDLASRKLVLLLPEAGYWELPGEHFPYHCNLETGWSADGSRLLVLIDSRWSTDYAFLVETKERRARNGIKSMRHGFDQLLRRSGGAAYREQPENYDMMFNDPWITARDPIEVLGSAGAFSSKTSELPSFLYYLTFSVESGSFSLQKSAKNNHVFEEPIDRQLNRAYRTLTALLPVPEREALVQEERIWINRRDATKGSEAKGDLTNARIDELTRRYENRISELEAEEHKPKED